MKNPLPPTGRRRNFRRLLTASLFVLIGCLDANGPTGPTRQEISAVALQVSQNLVTAGATAGAKISLPANVHLVPGSVKWLLSPDSVATVTPIPGREDSVSLSLRTGGTTSVQALYRVDVGASNGVIGGAAAGKVMANSGVADTRKSTLYVAAYGASKEDKNRTTGASQISRITIIGESKDSAIVGRDGFTSIHQATGRQCPGFDWTAQGSNVITLNPGAAASSAALSEPLSATSLVRNAYTTTPVIYFKTTQPGTDTLVMKHRECTGLCNDTLIIDVLAAAAGLKVNVSSPKTMQVGVAANPPIKIDLVDKNGALTPLNGFNITTVPVTTGLTLLAGSSVTTAAGAAPFSALRLSGLVGTYRLRFSTPTIPAPVDYDVTLTAGPASGLRWTTPFPTTASTGAAIDPCPVSQLIDIAGNPVAQAGVVLTVKAPDGTVLGTATTDARGIATFCNIRLPAGSGPIRLDITSSAPAITDQVTIRRAVPARIEITPSTAYINIGQTVQLTATVYDSAGTVIGGGTFTWSSSNSGVAPIDGSGLVTGRSSGVTTVSVTALGLTGTATVYVGGAAKFVITGLNTQTAGTAQTITITAYDSAGRVAVGYAGLRSLTIGGANASPNGTIPTIRNSSGTNINFGSITTLTFTNGVATAVMTLYKAESALITATDGTTSTVSTSDKLAVTVSPAAPSAATSTMTVTTTYLSVNGTTTVTITVRDPYGNIITNATPSMLTSSVTGGTLGGFTCINGVCTATYTAPSTPGSPQISVRIGGTNLGGSPVTMTVTLAAAKFVITGSATQVAGTSQTITIKAYDSNGAVALSYDGVKSLTFSGAGTSPNGTRPTITDFSGTNVAFGTATSVAFANGVATVTMTLYKAESALIGTTDGTIETPTTADQLSVNVTVAAINAAASTLSVTSTTLSVNGTTTVTVTVRDPYGNVVTTARPTDFVASTSGGTLGSFTCTNGVCTATYTAPATTGSPTISATIGGTNIGNSPTTMTIVAAAAKLVITGSSTQTAGATQTITITAYNANGTVATGYFGAKSLTFSGANAAPAGNNPTVSATNFGSATSVTFTAGVATASMVLYKAETAVVATTDGTISAAGTDRLTVTVGAAAVAKLRITGSATQTAGSPQDITITALDGYRNTVTGYTGSKTLIFDGASVAPDGTTNPTVKNTALAAINFGSATVLTFSSGSVTTPMVLYAAETATISAADQAAGGPSSSGTDNLTVTVGAAVADLTKSSISSSPSTVAADDATTSTISVQLRDAYGNTTTSLGVGTGVTIGTDLGTLLSTVANQGNGLYTQDVKSAAPGGTATLTGTITGVGSIAGTTTVEFVSGAAAAAAARVVCTNSQPAGQSASSTVTVNLCDVSKIGVGDQEIVTLALDNSDDIATPSGWVKIASVTQSMGAGGNKSMLLMMFSRRFAAGNARTVTFTAATNHKWSVDMVTFRSSGIDAPSSSDTSYTKRADNAYGLTSVGMASAPGNQNYVIYYVLANSLTGNAVTPAPSTGLNLLANNNTGGTSSTSYFEFLNTEDAPGSGTYTAPTRTWTFTKNANSVLMQLKIHP